MTIKSIDDKFKSSNGVPVTLGSPEWMEAATIVQGQIKETVQQDLSGVTVRMAELTCPCDKKAPIVRMFQCLYCNVWFCKTCAEQHFGKTVAQYKQEALRGGE
ncbi:MAG: hypothetical protein GY862_27150 [Gammaproteobacteria bacterium]|nr:hypothetical protein [Gammaproteobacteria bacterium]